MKVGPRHCCSLQWLPSHQSKCQVLAMTHSPPESGPSHYFPNLISCYFPSEPPTSVALVRCSLNAIGTPSSGLLQWLCTQPECSSLPCRLLLITHHPQQ